MRYQQTRMADTAGPLKPSEWSDAYYRRVIQQLTNDIIRLTGEKAQLEQELAAVKEQQS